jgi:hypothetical protein
MAVEDNPDNRMRRGDVPMAVMNCWDVGVVALVVEVVVDTLVFVVDILVDWDNTGPTSSIAVLGV